MWQIEQEQLDAKTYHYFLLKNNARLSYRQVLDLWKSNADFREFYNDILVRNSFTAYFWEVRPVTISTLDEEFEFVLVDSSSLARISANSSPFQQQFVDKANIIRFLNLRGDAELLVPNANLTNLAFPHIAAFVRTAPNDWIDEFWRKVGEALEANLGQQARWLSTSGLGVYWVHIRVDSIPKYYVYRPYRNFEI